MFRITRRAWPEVAVGGKRVWTVWKPKFWSHSALARAGGSMECNLATALILIPPSAPRIGLFWVHWRRGWNE
jgi:hypothetical protein